MKILTALIKKEFRQIVRDISTIIISFVLPLMLLIIYMYGLNLDTMKVSIGINNDDTNPEISTLVNSFGHSDYVTSTNYINKKQMYKDMIRNKIRGMIVIPNDFSRNLSDNKTANLQVITDATEINTANAVTSYTSAIVQNWLASSKYKTNLKKNIVNPNPRYWYNQEIDSHYFILPGSLAITMTLIGILLTALVVAREWERGTMEALLTTNARKIDIVLAKYIPYYVLGMLSMAFSLTIIIGIFQIPFRGSFIPMFFVGSLFLLTSLGFGLMISTAFKDQFLASQAALAIGFMPSLMLSGLMFPTTSMPAFIRWISYLIPAKYFVSFVESEFMTGSVAAIIIVNSIYLTILAVALFIIVYDKTSMRLEQ